MHRKEELPSGQELHYDLRQTVRETVIRFLTDHGISLILLSMIVVMSFSSPTFLSLHNLMNVVRQVSVIAIVGIGVR